MHTICSAFYTELIRRQPDETQAEQLRRFYDVFDRRCRLNHSDKRRLWRDFEQALEHYTRQGLALSQMLARLDPCRLGHFYEKPSRRWLPLDDAAKLYPLSMERGRMSVFRLSATLQHPIVPALLQMALNFTVQRFPAYTATLKKGVFWHYLDATTRRYSAEPERTIPCQPIKISRSGAQSFRVLYYENRISVEFFHVLCDALGGMRFLTALVSEYLRLCGEQIAPDPRIPDILEPPPDAELENAFLRIPGKRFGLPGAAKPALQFGGVLTRTKPCQILHLQMDAGALKAVAERAGVSVTAYMLALFFVAGKAAVTEPQGYLNFQVPVDLRKYFPSPTLRNFVLPCGIGLPLSAIDTPAALCSRIDAQLRQKASKSAMTDAASAITGIIELVAPIPLVVKKPVFQHSYGFVSDRLYSGILSNLGVIQLPPDLARHVRSIDAVIGPSILQRARSMLVTYGGTATLTITKTTTDTTFEDSLVALLCADDIPFSLERSPLYGE